MKVLIKAVLLSSERALRAVPLKLPVEALKQSPGEINQLYGGGGGRTPSDCAFLWQLQISFVLESSSSISQSHRLVTSTIKEIVTRLIQFIIVRFELPRPTRLAVINDNYQVLIELSRVTRVCCCSNAGGIVEIVIESKQRHWEFVWIVVFY